MLLLVHKRMHLFFVSFLRLLVSGGGSVPVFFFFFSTFIAINLS